MKSLSSRARMAIRTLARGGSIIDWLPRLRRVNEKVIALKTLAPPRLKAKNGTRISGFAAGTFIELVDAGMIERAWAASAQFVLTAKGKQEATKLIERA